MSFFWGPRQDEALFKSVKVCFLPLFVLSKFEGPGFVYILLEGQSESALIFTHVWVDHVAVVGEEEIMWSVWLMWVDYEAVVGEEKIMWLVWLMWVDHVAS